MLYAYTSVVTGRKLVHGNDVWRGNRFASMDKWLHDCVMRHYVFLGQLGWGTSGYMKMGVRASDNMADWATRHMLVYAYMESVGMCGQHTDAGDAT